MSTIAGKLSPGQREESTTFVLVPVKKLDEAKSRLSPLLSDDERRRFCLEMLGDVLTAIRTAKAVDKTIVVSSDPQALQITKRFHAFPFIVRRTGLNHALSDTIKWCVSMEAKATLILPADIPLVSSEDINKILDFGRSSSMVICPSRGGNGTNALLLNPPRVTPTLYGQNSFQRYIDEASKRGIRFQVYRSPRIALDVDTVDDLADFGASRAKETHAYRFLMEIEALKRLEAHRRQSQV